MGQITELVQEAHKTTVEYGWWENTGLDGDMK